MGKMWHPIGSLLDARTDRDLRLAVLNKDGEHVLVFPCRRRGNSWVDAKSGRFVEVYPTHWDDWHSETLGREA